MKLPRRFAHRGFTLVEAMISLSFFLLILFAVYMVFETSTVTYAKGTRLQDVQQIARLALDDVSNQIRMTSYFPEWFETIPAGIPGCPVGSAGGCQSTTFGIHVATPTALAVFGNLDGFRDPSAGNNLKSRVFLFCLNNGNQLVARASAFVNGNAAPYTCPNPNATLGDVLATNVAQLNFVYFDTAGAQINPGGALDNVNAGGQADFTNTAQRTAVRKILITLRVSEQQVARITGTGSPPPAGSDVQSFVLTSVVRLRNL